MKKNTACKNERNSKETHTNLKPPNIKQTRDIFT